MTKFPWIRASLPELLLAAGLHLSSPTATAAGDLPYGSLGGVVCDRATGKPLRFATVVLVGTTMGTMAGDGGVFKIDAVPVGTYKITVSFVRYEPLVSMVRVDRGDVTSREFELTLGRYGMTSVSRLPDLRATRGMFVMK